MGMFRGLITKGRLSTCKSSIRSNSYMPGLGHFFPSSKSISLELSPTRKSLREPQFPEIPSQIVHTVLIARKDRSKRSVSELENYFVMLSFFEFSGKKIGSRKEKAFGEQLKIKTLSENDILFALVMALQNIKSDSQTVGIKWLLIFQLQTC